jgi:hypothetical protein
MFAERAVPSVLGEMIKENNLWVQNIEAVASSNAYHW